MAAELQRQSHGVLDRLWIDAAVCVATHAKVLIRLTTCGECAVPCMKASSKACRGFGAKVLAAFMQWQHKQQCAAGKNALLLMLLLMHAVVPASNLTIM